MHSAEREVAFDPGVLASYGHFFASLFGLDHPAGHAQTYSEAVRRGNSVVVVDAPDDQQAEPRHEPDARTRRHRGSRGPARIATAAARHRQEALGPAARRGGTAEKWGRIRARTEEKWGRIRIQESDPSEAHGGRRMPRRNVDQDSRLSEARQWWSKFGSDPFLPPSAPTEKSNHAPPIRLPPGQRRNLRHPRAVQAARQARHHQLCRRLSGQRDVRRRRHQAGRRHRPDPQPRRHAAIRRHRRLRAAARATEPVHGQQGRGRGRRRPDRHHRQPAGAGPAGQDHDRPRRQGDRRSAHLPGHHPVLPAVRRRADLRADRRERRQGRRAGKADRAAQAQVRVPDPHLRQPQRRRC